MPKGYRLPTSPFLSETEINGLMGFAFWASRSMA